MLNIVFVTCREIGGITADDQLVAEQLALLGARVVPLAWDNGAFPGGIDAFVVRSPWNYHLAADGFMQWIDAAAQLAPVFNEPQTIRWNAHKRYLFELEQAGVPIAPTVMCAVHERLDLARLMHERNWHEIIIKPAVSASSYMTAIVGATPHHSLLADGLSERFIVDGQAHLDRILETRDALIQPFMPEIFTRGERSLTYFDGEYSHCVQKDAFTSEPGGGYSADADEVERSIAERALATLPTVPVYARVDLLRNAEGAEHLMELELIDPELFIRNGPQAPRRMAETILARLR